MKLAITYALLAVVAIAVNISTQELTLTFYTGRYQLPLSVFAGTLTGLMVKYILDKRYIFRFRAKNTRHDGQTFVLYALMGVITTTIFWGFEFGFHVLFDNKTMRYLGGILGLILGYILKYYLDKRYVFRGTS